jgi:hypothetical protein
MAAATSAAPADGVTWYVIKSETGAPIGYASHEVAATPDGGRIVTDMQDLFLSDEEGSATHQVSQRVRLVDRAGRTVSIRDEAKAAGVWTRTETRISGDVAEVLHRTPHDHRVSRVRLPPDVRFDTGEGLLAGWNPVATPKLSYDAFDPDAESVEHVTFEPDPAAPPAERGSTVLRKSYEGDQLMAISRLRLDAHGEVVSITQPMFGVGLTMTLSDRAAATAPHPAYHPLLASMIKSPFRIPASAAAGHIRYRFGFRDGLTFDPPRTSEQAVFAEGDTVTVDVCSDCGPGLATDAASLADARRPTAWLQSDDPLIRDLARSLFGPRLTDARKMELLTELTAKRIAQADFSGHFSAVETLQRGSSDCFGTAVVLAALGRAAGIPTRVADGIVYSADRYHGMSNAFMPHSWVLAFVGGRWRSYDAALMSFDSTHIALTIGNGDDRHFLAAEQLASLLTWQAMTEVRTAPST